MLLGSYLAGTWMFRIMPESYYSGADGVNFWHVFAQVRCARAFEHAARSVGPWG